MANYEEIGKIEAAQRQLRACIYMFFERKDPIVIYTIAWSAYQILSDISKQKGISRMIEDNDVIREMGLEKEFLKAFRSPRNFFHHADKDHEEKIKFFPETASLMPILAADLYVKITGEDFPPGRVLNLWFYAKYPMSAPKEIKAAFAGLPIEADPDDYDLFLEVLNRSDG